MGADALRGQGGARGAFDEKVFDEKVFAAEMDVYPWPIIRCWHFIMQLSTRYFLGDHEGAMAAGWKARELIWTSMAHLQEPEFWYFFGLTLAAQVTKLDATPGEAPSGEATPIARARTLALLRARS